LPLLTKFSILPSAQRIVFVVQVANVSFAVFRLQFRPRLLKVRSFHLDALTGRFTSLVQIIATKRLMPVCMVYLTPPNSPPVNSVRAAMPAHTGLSPFTVTRVPERVCGQ
jgi:hypothetical protein